LVADADGIIASAKRTVDTNRSFLGIGTPFPAARTRTGMHHDEHRTGSVSWGLYPVPFLEG
jgi:hypothetical protein